MALLAGLEARAPTTLTFFNPLSWDRLQHVSVLVPTDSIVVTATTGGSNSNNNSNSDDGDANSSNTLGAVLVFGRKVAAPLCYFRCTHGMVLA
jgi:hypothetical protein